MIFKRLLFVVSSLFLIEAGDAFAQAPNISYTTPQTYAINKAITPLIPANTGGAVPATVYGQVTTFAGALTPGAADGLGAAARFRLPLGIAIDPQGNTYIGDDANSLIRKILPDGTVTTFAGNGAPTLTGVPGMVAAFDHPFGVALDGAGNLYVADEGHNLIRKVTPAGVISTLAGSGEVGSANGNGATASFNHPYGVAADAAGNVYVSDGPNNLIRKITPNGIVTTFAGTGAVGSADGLAATATFCNPSAIAVDASGNVYVSDCSNRKIRKITTNGVVSTVAGSGADGSADGTAATATFAYPYGLTVDANGNIYVVDQVNDNVRKITPEGMVSTIAGSGSAGSADGIGLNAGFNTPGGIAIDRSGNLIMTDGFNNEIRKIIVTGYTIDKPLPGGLIFDSKTGAITGTPTAVSPATSYTITAYNVGGSSSATVNITISDNGLPPAPSISYQTPQKYYVNMQIAPLAPVNSGGAVPAKIYGQVVTVAGSGLAADVDASGLQAAFNTPMGVTFDRAGNLFVSEQGNADIRKITPAGSVSTFAANPGNSAAAFIPFALVTPGQLSFDNLGNLFIADQGDGRIKKITSAGVASVFAGSGSMASVDGTGNGASFNGPYGLAVDAAGNIFDSDRGDSRLRVTDGTAHVTTLGTPFDGGAAGTNVKGLGFLGVDAAKNLYFGDSNQIKEITPGGTVNVLAGSSTLVGKVDGQGTAANFNGIIGVALNGFGDIFVGDANNNVIRRVTQAGLVTTVAGASGGGSNDGTGSSAGFNRPAGVVVDNTGNYLYVADSKNNTIRMVTITGYSIDKSLPTGLTFDPLTGTITGTPVFTSPSLVYTITAYNTGGSSSFPVTIEIDDATVSFSPIPVKTVCDADFDPGATSNVAVTYTSSDPSVATIVAGKVHITGPGTSVISASDGTTSATQTLTVDPAVVPLITVSPDAGNNYCQGSMLTYTATPTGGGAGPVYQWQLNGVNTGGNNPTFTSASLNNNDQLTCILTSNAACITTPTAVSNTITVNISQPETTSVSIVSTLGGPVCPGTQITFTATPNSPGNQISYQWQVNGIDVGTDNPVFTGSNFANGDAVTCNLLSSGPCIANAVASSAQITVSLIPLSECVITIPSAFTPNGDGVNDFWDITALQGYPDCVVTVFNRYGGEVYRSVGYSKAWNGTYSGSALPAGTYYYIIDLGSGKKKLSGAVTIIR